MGIRKQIFNLTLFINGFDVKRAKLRMDEFKGCTQDKLEMRKDSIVAYHLKNNPYYKKLCKNREYSGFEQLPILTKKDFQNSLQEMISENFKVSELYVSNTSGSSGHPFFFAKNKESHANTHFIAQQLYATYGIDANDKQARFYGIPAKGISRLKEKLKDFLSNRVRFPVFDMSDEMLETYLNRFRRINFGYVYGYSSAILIFARYLINKGIVLKDICPTLKCCIVTSEMCLSEDLEVIEKALGVAVINEYGCSETGIIAFTNSEGVWEMTTQDCYYEVVDDKGNTLPYGQQGRLCITSLSNLAMPFIRYQIGDIGIIERYRDGLKLVQLTGRVNDIVKLPSGKIAAGLTFYYISRSILENNNNIKEFIIRQTKIDTFIFDIVSDKSLSESDIIFLQEQMNIYLELGLIIEINRVDEIIRPSSGKIKHFYSEIQN